MTTWLINDSFFIDGMCVDISHDRYKSKQNIRWSKTISFFSKKKCVFFFHFDKIEVLLSSYSHFQLYMKNELCMLTMLNICSLNTFFYVYDTTWFDRFVNILLWRLCEFSTFARFYHLFHCWYVANQKLESLCNKFYSAHNTGSNGRSPHG